MRPDRAAVQEELAEIWRRLLHRDDITVDSDYLLLAPPPSGPLLIDEIRRRFGVTLSLPVLYRDSRLGDLAETIATGDVPADIRYLVRLRRGHREPAMLYVPGAFGEDVHARERLAELDFVTYLLLARGLEEGERPLRTVAELAEYYLDRVLGRMPHPLVVAGFSMGALVAVEMARRGALRGWRPLRIVLIDLMPMAAGTDTLSEDDIITFRLQRLVDEREALGAPGPAPVCFGAELTADKVDEVVDYLYRSGSPALPRGVPWSFLERRLRVYAVSMLAAGTHRVRPCDVPITHVRTAEARQAGIAWPDLTTAGPPEVLDVDATHSDLWQTSAIVRALSRCLADEQRRRAPG